MDELIRIRSACAARGARAVLRGVDLEVRRGEVLGMLGINGAGKSTLVDVLVGRHPLASGSMVLAGEPYAPTTIEESQACGVGVVAQNAVVPTELTVARALFRNTYRADEDHDSVRERAGELLRDAEVELDPDRLLADLDRGSRALVEVVRMLAEEAQLVIIDEVAVTLADHEIAQLHHILRRLVAQGRGVLYITHRLDEVRSLVDRVVVLRGGRVAEDRAAPGLGLDELAELLLGAPASSSGRPQRAVGSYPGGGIAAIGIDDGVSMRGIDLVVRSGEMVGITGAYDSGVREFLEVLGGVRRLVRGRLERDGREVWFESTEQAQSAGVSYLPDEAPGTVVPADRRLIAGVADAEGELAGEIRRARRMIALVRELRINTTDINSDVAHLSGGDQQKAEFVRAVERGGEVLVLAHPARGVDVGAREALFGFLHTLAAGGAAVLFLESDMAQLKRWSDRVVVIAHGRVVLDAPSTEVDEDILVHSAIGEAGRRRMGRRSRPL